MSPASPLHPTVVQGLPPSLQPAWPSEHQSFGGWGNGGMVLRRADWGGLSGGLLEVQPRGKLERSSKVDDTIASRIQAASLIDEMHLSD